MPERFTHFMPEPLSAVRRFCRRDRPAAKHTRTKMTAYLLVFKKLLARAASGELGNFLISSCIRALAAAPWLILLKLMPCFR